MPGGALRSGPLVSMAPAHWPLSSGTNLIEIQTCAPVRSRTTGIMEEDGRLYVPCDLGFIWKRAKPPARWPMALFGTFKNWHQTVLRDGRVVVRAGGQRYPFTAVRVEDPALHARLRDQIDGEAKRVVPRGLGPHPDPGADPEQSIWFFRLDPRDD